MIEPNPNPAGIDERPLMTQLFELRQLLGAHRHLVREATEMLGYRLTDEQRKYALRAMAEAEGDIVDVKARITSIVKEVCQ